MSLVAFNFILDELELAISQFLLKNGFHSIEDLTIQNYKKVYDVDLVYDERTFTVDQKGFGLISLSTSLPCPDAKKHFLIHLTEIACYRYNNKVDAALYIPLSPVESTRMKQFELISLFVALPTHIKNKYPIQTKDDLLYLADRLNLPIEYIEGRYTKEISKELELISN